MPRASWNGFRRFSLVYLPGLSGPGDEACPPQLAQPRDRQRVAQQLVDSKAGEIVDRDCVFLTTLKFRRNGFVAAAF